MKPLLLALAFLLSPMALANEGLKTPDVLKEKWGEVRDTAVLKYQKVRDSDIGTTVHRKAIDAKNSNVVKSLMAKATGLWHRALAKGKSLLVSADVKLHEKVLDPPAK